MSPKGSPEGPSGQRNLPVWILEATGQMCWIRAIPLWYCPAMIQADSDSRAFLVRCACATTMFCTALMWVGCGRSASPEAVDLLAAGPAPRRALTDLDRSALIQAVRQSSPRPGAPTVDAWVANRVANAGGPLLYSDWIISPGEDGVHEVRFSYTWRTPSFEILRDTLTWTVLEDTRVVTGPLDDSSNDDAPQEDPMVEERPAVRPVANATEPSS